MQVNTLPDLVKAAVCGDTCRFLTFYTEPLNAQDTKACVDAVGGYNEFESSAVNQAIDEIAQLDPNVRFILAREYSMALYVWRSKLPVPQLMSILEHARPDELDPTDDETGDNTEYGIVRAWWD